MPRSAPASEAMSETIRLDKWLWQTRLYKTRSLAAEAAEKGIRVNGLRITKPGKTLRIGDVLSFAYHGKPLSLRVEALGERRGPAPEAATLYTVLSA